MLKITDQTLLKLIQVLWDETKFIDFLEKEYPEYYYHLVETPGDLND